MMVGIAAAGRRDSGNAASRHRASQYPRPNGAACFMGSARSDQQLINISDLFKM
ncbi:Uncharacterised protein [Salmonella enterica subsp. enterica serovar Typhimurium str. DT104]|nr:Uncharacterised protein [Salmonella enterica subsp. enterica serovar Typhimurium str. DT104]